MIVVTGIQTFPPQYGGVVLPSVTTRDLRAVSSATVRSFVSFTACDRPYKTRDVFYSYILVVHCTCWTRTLSSEEISVFPSGYRPIPRAWFGICSYSFDRLRRALAYLRVASEFLSSEFSFYISGFRFRDPSFVIRVIRASE